MFRLLTATCPRCSNRFHVDAEAGDAPPFGGYRCRCPRCNTWFAVPCEAGVPQPGSTPWAIHADRVEN